MQISVNQVDYNSAYSYLLRRGAEYLPLKIDVSVPQGDLWVLDMEIGKGLMWIRNFRFIQKP